MDNLLGRIGEGNYTVKFCKSPSGLAWCIKVVNELNGDEYWGRAWPVHPIIPWSAKDRELIYKAIVNDALDKLENPVYDGV